MIPPLKASIELKVLVMSPEEIKLKFLEAFEITSEAINRINNYILLKNNHELFF